MFCSACGNKITADDLFCGECGHKVEKEMPFMVVQPKRSITLPKLNRMTKIISGVVAGVIGIGLIGYLVARVTYGPATPEVLEKKFNEALQAGDMKRLTLLVDPNQPQMISSQYLEAFKATLDDNVKKQYQNNLADARKAAETATSSKDSKSKQVNSIGSSKTFLQFVNDPSWRGNKWSVHIYPTEVAFQNDGKNSVKANIGAIADTTGVILSLWPSVYKYEGTISNDFASQPFSGTANVLNASKFSYNPTSSIKSSLTVRFPELKDVTVTLNDKPLVVPSGKQDVTISPAPATAKLVVTSKLMGSPIQGTLSVDTSKNVQVILQDALKEDISKKALDVITLASETWVKAYNSGDPAQMKSVNPDSSYYKDIAGRMTKPADVKVKLLKAAVNPESLNIRGDSITLNASEMYQYDSTPGTQSPQPSTANWTYTLQQIPSKEEWWITNHSSSWFGENVFTSKTNYVKESTEPTAQVTAPAATAEQDKNKDIADIKKLIENYEKSLIEAINSKSFGIVEPYLTPSSSLYKAQVALVDSLSKRGTKEELVQFEVLDIKSSDKPSQYVVKVKENITIITDTKQTKEFTWLYTVDKIGDKWTASEIKE